MADGVPCIRYYAGDIVIVIFLYSLLRSLKPGTPPLFAALSVFVYACAVEFLQLAGVPGLFDTSCLWVKVVLGTRFEWLDLLMYAVGLGLVLAAERFSKKSCNQNL